ncbi:MAG: hypothetical protein GXO34_05545 [Deltaproteobacteria bacterium]|nr:hypothetical protein [Deltaproteobacteria bacterium]
MKKFFTIFAVIMVALLFSCVASSLARQIAAPPLLEQQPAPPPIPPAVGPNPAPPGVAPGPAAPPPAPAPGPGVPPPAGPGRGRMAPARVSLASLSAAVATVKEIEGRFLPGKVWALAGPAGETDCKAGVLYQGSVVAVLHFNPLNGEILPLGMRPPVCPETPQINMVKAKLATIVQGLKILPVAQFREPEASWVFPLTCDSKIVAYLKVYCDGIHIVPDYPMIQEMARFGR